MLFQLCLLAAGFVLLIKGADWFVDGAAGIAAKLHIPQLIIGLTVVAMGTSAPEAAVSISAALKGTADITVGNILGSNILNILVILGMAAAVAPLAVSRATVRQDMPFLIGVSLLLLVLGFDSTINFLDGVVLLLFFVSYLAYLIYNAKKEQKNAASTGAEPPVHRWWQLFMLTAVGLVVIVLGSSVAVDAATEIARLLGLSERFIGLTIVALGTSLPELFTSVTAAGKGNADIAIGNIVGSNLFNILFVVGISSLIVPVPFAMAFRFDAWVAIASAVLLLLCCAKGKTLKRWHGVLLLVCYAAYFLMIL